MKCSRKGTFGAGIVLIKSSLEQRKIPSDIFNRSHLFQVCPNGCALDQILVSLLISSPVTAEVREPNASPVGISTVSLADLLFCLGCWFGSVWSDYGSVQSSGPADDDLDCELTVLFPDRSIKARVTSIDQ